MLVYGDPQFSEPLAQTCAHLRAQIECTRPVLDDLRMLLIHAGQVEQAVEDCSPALPEPLRERARALTDLAAGAFVSCWSGGGAETEARLQQLRASTFPHPAGFPGNEPICIKVPEGYEFYTLYPEQYCLAARAWARHHDGSFQRRVLVVGIRSIGTSLSAVVRAVLAQEGWQPRRITLRPGGHPFDRNAGLPEFQHPPDAPALIVDEGPGISGSTIYSTARSLQARGITQISLLPGHTGMPGHAASPAARDFWLTTPRFFTPAEALRWKGRTLPEVFSAACGAPVLAVTELSGGQWRTQAFASVAQWPAVVPVLERTKYLCRHAKAGLLLWKFTGLGSRMAPAPAAPAHHSVRHPPILGRVNGFTATRWIEGSRLQPAEAANPATLSQLADYLAASAGPPLDESAWEAATARLNEMLVQNALESLGQDAAAAARTLASALSFHAPCPAYTDGRMASWEWVRDQAGRLWKTDSTGHVVDHTIIGEQSLAWDVAGLAIEWNFSPATVAILLRQLAAHGIVLPQPECDFYLAAYAAFRLGVCALFAPGAGPAEQSRLQQRGGFYQAKLSQYLSRIPVAGALPASKVSV